MVESEGIGERRLILDEVILKLIVIVLLNAEWHRLVCLVQCPCCSREWREGVIKALH
jgi:hypothetical protein